MNQTTPQTGVNQKKGFWQRQFQARATSGQQKFDWIFGLVMPAICFLFDPIVFKGSFFGGESWFAKYKPFAYVLSYISMAALFAFLTLGRKAKHFNALFAGIFLTGGIISLIVGIVVFPFSLIGLIIVIGVLGFTPLLTALVFLRNSVRAFQIAKPFFDARKLWSGLALAAILSFGFPLALNVQIERIFAAVKQSDAAEIRANLRTFRMLAPIVNPDRLIREYNYGDKNIDGERQTAIAEIYFAATGEDISQKPLF